MVRLNLLKQIIKDVNLTSISCGRHPQAFQELLICLSNVQSHFQYVFPIRYMILMKEYVSVTIATMKMGTHFYSDHSNGF